MTNVREYHTIDKSAWGEGPWTKEPDKVSWTDEATGLPCLIVRNPSGALCGYAGVAKDHPAHGMGYMQCVYGADGNERVLPTGKQAIYDITVHGGLTFADGCSHGDEATSICHIPEPGQPDDVWWFGFDCAHYGDLTPEVLHRYPNPSYNHGTYRDLNYVKDQVEKLAVQLKAIAI